MAAARLTSIRARAIAATVALLAFLALSLVLPIPARAFTMGDGSSITQDRGNFVDLVHRERVIRFSAHLAYQLLDRFDTALGRTNTSPTEAYRMLSWLVGAAISLSLWFLALTDGWSPRSVRFVALALMAPAALMYFGYLEVGYLSLSAAAFPFIARDLVGRVPTSGTARESDPATRVDLTGGVLAGSVLFGLGAAMHGIGYLSIAAIFLAILVFDIPVGRRIVLATAVSFIACGAALIWLWYYLSQMNYDITPGHAAGGFLVRPLLHAREAETRIMYPILSVITARDVFVSGLIAGLPLMLVVLLARRAGLVRPAEQASWPREARLALAFALPCLIMFVLFWPPQGIAIEMDMIVALFPAVYALLWVCSQSTRASIVSAVLLAIGHATFWWVVFDDRFINRMLR